MKCQRCFKEVKEIVKVPHQINKNISLEFCISCAKETGSYRD
jgi:NMD protein affecting ribosome stability and mRNA decay